MNTLLVTEEEVCTFTVPRRGWQTREATFRVVRVTTAGPEAGPSEESTIGRSWSNLRLDVMDPPGAWRVLRSFDHARPDDLGAAYLAALAWVPPEPAPPPVRGLAWHVARAIGAAVRAWSTS